MYPEYSISVLLRTSIGGRFLKSLIRPHPHPSPESACHLAIMETEVEFQGERHEADNTHTSKGVGGARDGGG